MIIGEDVERGTGDAGATPVVSVVIPTTGRDSLVDAVASALGQDLQHVEIVVAVSGDRVLGEQIRKVLPPRVKIAVTGQAGNANVARNLGVDSSRGQFIALLDDDDCWDTTKLRKQLQALKRSPDPENTICATAYRLEGRFEGEVWPVRSTMLGETMGDYLFTRTSLRRRPTGYQTSTLMAHRSIFARCRFDEGLAIHQDWDWLVRACDNHGFGFVFINVPLSVYRYGTGGTSITSSTRWRQSVSWATSENVTLSERARGDFLLTIALDFAARQASISDILRLVRTAFVGGRPGLAASLTFPVRIVRGLVMRTRVAGRGRHG